MWFQVKSLPAVCLFTHLTINICVCLQTAAPAMRASAMRAVSVGATQLSTGKLKV